MKKRTRVILASIVGGALLLVGSYAAYAAYDHYCRCGSGSSVFRGAEEVRELRLPFSRTYGRKDSILAKAYLREPFVLKRGNESQYLNVAQAFFHWRADSIAEGILKNIVEIPDSVYIPGGPWLQDPNSPTGEANRLDMYKQQACKALVWLSIEKQDYEQAEKYRLLIKNKYNRTYSCMVRSPDYENGTKEMKTIILYRLKDYRGVIHNERNSFYESYHPWLAAAIQRQYTHQQICQEFKKAFSSIQFSPEPRWWILSEIPDSAKATMTLFGEKIDMIVPELEAGKKAKKKDYIDRFKKSFVYDELITGRPECD